MRRALLLGFAALACAGIAAGGALAAKQKIDTKVTVSNVGPGLYAGVVTAKKGCQQNREVEVWHDTNGDGVVNGEPIDFLIGRADTDAGGNFEVPGNQAPTGDNIIAVATKDKRGKKIICREGQGVGKSTGGAT